MSVFLTGVANINNIDDKLINAPIGVNNAGFTKIDSANLSTYRPEGRKDYQLIFVKSGICYLNLNNTEIPIPQNNIIVYRPYESQHYKFFKQDRTEIFWVHFGGTWVEEIFKEIGITDLKHFPYTHSEAFIGTVNFIMNELRKNEPLCNMNCIAKLMELFVAIGRRNEEVSFSVPNPTLMDKICLDIANNYFLETTNEEYASKYNMSVSYFIKSFKAATGTTPQQFKALQRLRNAENLLSETDLKITEISHLLGFADSLYFSKFFNKTKGMSPSEFRQKYKNQHET